MRAHCLIRPAPFYRREAFVSGLKAAGYDVRDGQPDKVQPGDVLATWNRYGTNDAVCTKFEREGGVCVICENGYLGAGGVTPKFAVHPHGPRPGDYYALALGGHNGSGNWFTPPDTSPEFSERWARLGVPLKPLRTDGSHILVCPSRSFGRPGQVMPADWPDVTAGRLRALTDRPVEVRAHPGNNEPKRPLSADLEGAWAVVIWASSAGIHALVAGIPVVQCAPRWICERGAFQSFEALELNTAPDADESRRLAWHNLRKHALRRMAWAQWTVEEIASGEPFARLLRRAGQEKVAENS